MDLSHVPWEKIAEAGTVIISATAAAFRGAVKGHARAEVRMREIEHHLRRQDDHMARQDKTIESTHGNVSGHLESFDEHTETDKRQFEEIKKELRSLARRLPKPPPARKVQSDAGN